MSTLIHDLKTGWRGIASKPGFAVMVAGMLALGIAGNAAIFSIFNGLFLRPLPFEQAERLVGLDETAPKWNLQYVGISNPDFYAWRKDNRTFDSMAFFSNASFNLSGHGLAQRIRGALVTADMLKVLRLKPALGRNFLPEEDRKGGAKVVLLGYDLWQRLFNGGPHALGRILKVDNEPYTVVGVLPRSAVFPSDADMWAPLAADPNDFQGYYLNGVGRLKPGVSLDQARADLGRVHKLNSAARKDPNPATSPLLAPLRDRYLGEFRTVTHVLLGAVVIVLLIACVNVAGLMLVRAATRSREIAIRTAMGASRTAILRQLLTESLMLSSMGGIVGVLLGSLALRGMLSLIPQDMPRWINFSMDWRFLVFCAGITCGSAILFGLAPALQAAKADLRACLHESGARASLSKRRRNGLSALVVCEISLALLLLICAGLVAQAFRRVMKVDPGFRPENVLTFAIALPEAKYPKPEQQSVFFDSLLERMRAIPGVRSAGAASPPPLMGHSGYFFVAEGGRALGPNEQDPVVLQVVATPRYFDAIGTTQLAGRTFDDRDGDPNKVAIVNESFAKRFWPKADPLGKRIRYRWEKDQWMEVIGVTRDVKHYGLDQEMRPSVYIPFRQMVNGRMAVVLRGAIDPLRLVAPAREALQRMDPDLPMFEIRTMSERLDRSLWARRFYSWLIGAFAIIALLLAAAGIYGVISYAVTQRTQEIGIRIALGARPVQVLRKVLGQGMALVLAGSAIGVAAAFYAARFLETLLFGLSARDPLTYAAVVVGVACVAIFANLVPARRAAAVDPVRALRSE